jgi:hypothetical protein
MRRPAKRFATKNPRLQIRGLTASLAILIGISAGVVAGCGASDSYSTATYTSTTATNTSKSSVPKVSRAEELLAAQRARVRARFARRAAVERAEVTVGTQTFAGDYFGIDFPATWNVEAREVSRGSYLDTTIRSSIDPNKMIRVDVQPRADYADPLTNANVVRRALSSQTAYRELDFSRTTFNGYDAIRWEFLVSEDGVLLHKVDNMFVDDVGESVAVLTQAPASVYRYWERLFQDVDDSFVANDVGGNAGGGTQVGFCETHSCIDNFDNGIGYIVQCSDGMWSHSGGRPGACSYHGGESATTSGGPTVGSSNGSYPGSNDLGPGNGYAVTCVDGSTSHSGGIQGACSHHGGVGP